MSTGTENRKTEKVVGVHGFEHWNLCSQIRCATRLRYTPTESIFYTESAIAGKSCKIHAMVAYFSSKFKKQIQVALSIVLLAFCLLGTRWIGLSHSISHANFQSQTEISSTAVDATPSQKHNSDVCHLFDALTLAGFVATDTATPAVHDNHANHSVGFDTYYRAQAFIEHYQSRAPPTLLS